MEFNEFFSRRNSALALGVAGNLLEAEKALRALLADSQYQSQKEPHWMLITKSDLAVTLAKKGEWRMAEEYIQEAYRMACKSHPFVELLVTYNRSVVYEVFGDTEQSVDWAWRASEITRMHESVLPRLGGKTTLDSLFFELGTMALHVVIDYYCQVEHNFEHAETFVPEALRWINRAIQIENRSSEKGRDLIREQARLLILLGNIKMGLGLTNEARDNFLKASKLHVEAGDPDAARNAARLAGFI